MHIVAIAFSKGLVLDDIFRKDIRCNMLESKLDLRESLMLEVRALCIDFASCPTFNLIQSLRSTKDCVKHHTARNPIKLSFDRFNS